MPNQSEKLEEAKELLKEYCRIRHKRGLNDFSRCLTPEENIGYIDDLLAAQNLVTESRVRKEERLRAFNIIGERIGGICAKRNMIAAVFELDEARKEIFNPNQNE